EFTGAAAELRQAYLVNPHDTEFVKDAIEAALNQSGEEGRRRMRALRRQVLVHDVDRWARSFLDALAAGHPSNS
ncbi:MAG: trehalose 6-phosphate synthase, partial [Mycobacterium sp.]|nr:trehalose 6-phosphate synthase [Mycobacterium sp.]